MTVAKREAWSTPATRRVGYVVAAAVNAGLLYVAQHLLGWELLPWLTAEFEDVLPLISLTLMASILFNLAYVAYDAAWFKSLTQIVALAVGLAATVQLLVVFPFDFSAYEFNWAVIARLVLGLVIVGTVIAMISEAVKLARAIIGD